MKLRSLVWVAAMFLCARPAAAADAPAGRSEAPVGRSDAPVGQMTWGVHTTLVPTYFDPAETIIAPRT